MALTVEQRLDALVPQYATHPAKAAHIEMAEEQTSSASSQGWNDAQRSRAVALRAAHTLTLALDPAFAGGGGGGVQVRREGDLQITYRTTSAKVFEKYPDLAQTSFGTELIGLINSCWPAVGCSSGLEDTSTYEW